MGNYLTQLSKANSISELNSIIKAATYDDNITVEENCDLYSIAIDFIKYL